MKPTTRNRPKDLQHSESKPLLFDGRRRLLLHEQSQQSYARPIDPVSLVVLTPHEFLQQCAKTAPRVCSAWAPP